MHVTGNTVIDALYFAASQDVPIGVPLDESKRLILVTAHRRGTIGALLREICNAVASLHQRLPDVEFLWPVHPNPGIAPVVRELLSSLPRVHLCEPMGYGPFVAAMKRSSLILTDSGGIQEEAPALGKPVLVLRSESERPEAVITRCASLVGHDPVRIVAETIRILTAAPAVLRSVPFSSPFGDGRASERIVAAIAAQPRLRAARPVRGIAFSIRSELAGSGLLGFDLRKQRCRLPAESAAETVRLAGLPGDGPRRDRRHDPRRLPHRN